MKYFSLKDFSKFSDKTVFCKFCRVMPSFLTWIQSKYNDLYQGNHQKSIKYTSIIIPAIVCQKRIY